MSQNAGVEGTTSQGQQQNNSGGTGSQGQETQQQGQTQPGNQQQQQQPNSPYAPYLERVPESVRGIVEPIFKDWDAGVTQRFQQVHSQYGWAEPWQEIAQNYDPDTVSQAVQVLSALNDNPQGFYEALGNAYGLTPAQAQQAVQQGQLETQQNQQGDIQPDPRYQQLEETVGTLANLMMEREQNEQFQQEEQQLMSHLDALKQQYGEFDQDYVITKIAAGIDPEQAVQAYRNLVQGQAQQLMAPGQNAPIVMGSGGGTPSRSTELRSLDRKSTQGLVAQVLAANKNG